MTQFTANEVRDYLFSIEERSSRQWLIAHDAELGMLRQFADLLEAQEKGVPVMVVNHVSSAEHDLPIGMKLYAHPTPADAEPPSSLQESLCVLENAALHGLVLHGDDIPRLRATVDKIAPDKPQPDAERLAEAVHNGLIDALRHQRQIDEDGAEVGVSREAIDDAADILSALAAHSAQAQPPAARVPDIDTMVNRFLSWRLPQDFAPDAGISFKPMPDEYMPHCWPTGTNLFHAGQVKEMILHMLAARENPNG